MNHSQLSLSEIIHLNELEKLFEAFSFATGFSSGLIDLANNEVMLQTGWRGICSRFHRTHPDSIQHCLSSNRALINDLHTLGEIRIEHCRNGLVDGCTPIVIAGIHLANLCTGQVFFSPPDINRFKEQAQQYGYDEQSYLDAVAKVPVVEEKQFTAMLQFLAQITTTTVQLAMTNLQAEKSHKESLLGIAVDISERVQLEKELKKERQRLLSILKGTNVGTWEWNVQTGEVIINECFLSMLGYTLEEFPSFSFEEFAKLCHHDDLKEVGVLLEKHFSGELDSYECEMRLRHKNGDLIWVLARGKVAVWTEEGKPLLMFGTHQDITKRKQAEEALQNSHDTLEQRVSERTRELEKIHDQLRHVDKLAAMGQFTASIAHEINNPLTGILNVLERLRRKVALEENEEKLLAMALNEGERMRRLIQDLQSFNRPSSGKMTVFELQKAVATILKLSGKELRLHHVNVETCFAPAPIKINGVEDQIIQVFLNLMRNSMDALPVSDGEITLTTTVEGLLATISFHDNGCGIKPEHLDKIFDSFFTTKSAVKGTGLGLSVSYNIIKAHGGDMSVSSEPDKGTTFIINLPIHQTQER